MLSIEDPPCSSCSCKISELRGDERTTKKLALKEAEDLVKVAALDDEIKHQPRFSIRDYAFATRSKDIGVNWPFPQQFLQLCLEHGVKDLLPPFECPHLARAQSCRKDLRSNQLIARVDSEKASQEVDLVEEENAGLSDLKLNDFKHVSCQMFNKSTLQPSDHAQSLLSEVGILASDQGDELCRISKTMCSNEIDGEETAPEASLELEAAKLPQASSRSEALCGPSGKKRRLIVKLGVNYDSNRTEENLSNSGTATEAMASKVCPVCKTFTSTSNTTLNAHIDQCLATESSSKRVITKLTKQKVKPKKRLMVDIYLTAPCCTLEDLERRNCVNRVVDSTLQIPNGEVHAENKRQRLTQVNYNDDGEESAVYVDSNGMKLRILSKLNDVSVPTEVENCKPRKNIKDGKEGRSFLIRKKKHLELKASMYPKVKPQSKKLLNKMLYKDKVHEAHDGIYHVENHEKEECLSQLLKARDSFKGSRSGTLRQWVCSKRICLPKKLNETSSHHGASDDPLVVTQNPLIRRNRSTSGNSSIERSYIHKLSRFSVNSHASPMLQSKTGNLVDNKVDSPKPPKNTSNWVTEGPFIADGHNLEFSTSLENNISPRSKRGKIDTITAERSPKLSDSLHFLPKAKKIPTLKGASLGKPSLSVEANKSSDSRMHSLTRKNGKRSIFKKSLKERCMMEMRDLVGALPFDADRENDRMQGSTEISGPSNNVMMSEAEAFADKVFLGRSQVLNSADEREEAAIALERPENTTSKKFPSTNECCKLDEINVDSQVGGGHQEDISSDICPFKSSNQVFSAEEVTVSADTGITYFVEKAVRDQTSNTHNDQSDSSFSLGEEPMGPIFGTRAWMEPEPVTPISCGGQETHFTVFGEEGGTSSQTLAEVNYIMEGDSSDDQYMRCITDSTPIQGPGDAMLKARWENSSVTSIGPWFIKFQSESVNRDLSASLVSATSTISPPPMGLSDFKCLEMELSENSTKQSLVDAINFGPSCALPFAERTKSKKQDMEVKISPGGEPNKISDCEPCCCLRKGSVNQGPALIYQESANQNQMTSNQNIGPVICNSFTTFQSSITDEKVAPSLGMMIDSIRIKEFSDDAVKSPNCSDLVLVCPSSNTQPTSIPILRLMGQNLILANNDEDESTQLPRVPLGSAENNRPNEKSFMLARFPIGNVSGEDTLSIKPPQNSSSGFSNGFRNCGKMAPTPPQLPRAHQDKLHMGGFMVSGFAARVKR